jgi:hypothetical protein
MAPEGARHRAERRIASSVFNRPTSATVDAGGERGRQPHGFWLALRAARLSSDQPVADRAAAIVVTIEEASASERLELFGRAFGLSVREYDRVSVLSRALGAQH